MRINDALWRISMWVLAGVLLAPALVSAAQQAAPAAGGEEWPRWRGPRGDGISHEPIADKWPEGGPKKLWEQPTGIGFSSPIGFGGKVYVFSAEEMKDEKLTAYDAESGKVAWSQSYPMRDKVDYPGTRATPFIDGDFVYTYGAGGDLVCWALADGKIIWQLNVVKETGETLLGEVQVWAEASSPLVAGDLVYVQGGKGGPVAVAVDKKSGKIAWRSEAKGLGGYAACVLGDVAGAKQLFVFGGDKLYGMGPATGKTLWSQPWKTNYNINAATPVFDGEHLFISSYGHGCMMLQVSKSTAKDLWHNRTVQCKIQAPVLDGNLLFANADNRGTIKCLSWPDGAVKWAASDPELLLGPGGSILRDADKLITMSESGTLSLVKTTAQGAERVGQVKLFTVTGSQPDIWSTPLLYHGKLYAKGENQLVCLDVKP